MARCSTCKKKRADAAPTVEFTDDEKKIIYAMEMAGARQQRTIVLRRTTTQTAWRTDAIRCLIAEGTTAWDATRPGADPATAAMIRRES